MLTKKTELFRSMMLSVGLLAMPVLAHADLTIVNNTAEDSTSVLNGGICSVSLGDVGTTKAKMRNVVPQQTLSIACFFHPNDCRADIFMNPPPPAGQKPTCNGFPIATVVFSTTTGVTEIQLKAHPSKHYKVSAKGFYIQIDPA